MNAIKINKKGKNTSSYTLAPLNNKKSKQLKWISEFLVKFQFIPKID